MEWNRQSKSDTVQERGCAFIWCVVVLFWSMRQWKTEQESVHWFIALLLYVHDLCCWGDPFVLAGCTLLWWSVNTSGFPTSKVLLLAPMMKTAIDPIIDPIIDADWSRTNAASIFFLFHSLIWWCSVSKESLGHSSSQPILPKLNVSLVLSAKCKYYLSLNLVNRLCLRCR